MRTTPSQFEEKEFEAPLYNQLEHGTRMIWCPGQVFEQYIGIDRALFLDDPLLWRILGRRRRMPGVFLEDYDWPFIWRRRRNQRPLPDFRLNLFVQAKRCFYHPRRPRRLRNSDISGPCWRFDLDQSQQTVLERVAEKLDKRALVCYAAPAFHRLSQLYGFTRAGEIVENSTFPEVRVLSKHDAWFYDRPGGTGVACSEPESIHGPSLLEQLHVLARGRPEQLSEERPLRRLHRIIYSTVSEEVSDENARRFIYFELLRNFERTPLLGSEELSEEKKQDVHDFFAVSVFAEAFNLEWFVTATEV